MVMHQNRSPQNDRYDDRVRKRLFTVGVKISELLRLEFAINPVVIPINSMVF